MSDLGVENIVAEVKETIEAVVEEVKEELKEKVEEVKEHIKEELKEKVEELAENAIERVEEVTQKKCVFLLPILKILKALFLKKKQVSSVTVHKYTVCDECKNKISLKEEVKAEAS